MSGSDKDQGFIQFPERSYRPVVVSAVVVLGLIVTVARLFFAVTDEDEGPERSGAVADHASDAATRPAAVLPGIEDLLADAELPAGPRGGLVVADTGVTTVADRFNPDEAMATFAVVVDNPHPDGTATSVEISVDLITADGAVVDNVRFLVPTIPMRSSVAVAGVATSATVPGVETVASIDVSTTVARWDEASVPGSGIVTGEVETDRGPIGGLTSSTTVTNGGDGGVSDVNVVVVLRRHDGTIIGGYDAYVDAIAPGETVNVVVHNPADIDPSAVARADVFTSSRVG